MDAWSNLLQTFGLAVVILMFVGLAAWKSAKWLAAEIIVPLRDRLMVRFVSFLDRIEATVGKLDVNVDTVTLNLQQQTASLKGVQTSNAKIEESTGAMVTAIRNEHTELGATVSEAVTKAENRHELVMAEFKMLHAEIKDLLAEVKTRTNGK